CIDPKTSTKHCGTCNNACGAGMECREVEGGTGACQCDAGHFDCDGDPANGCESTTECVCKKGQKQACWRGTPETRGKGACKDGEQKCDDSGKFWGPCEGGTYPSSVTCDIKGKYIGGDQNCNGIADEQEECKTQCELLLSESTYIGCEYWAAYTDNVDTGGNYAVIISNMGDQDATVTVYKYNNNTVAATRVVKKGTVETIELAERGNGRITGTTIQAAGFRIVSSSPVTAYQFNPLRQNAVWNDALLLLPKNVYGKRYFNIIGSGSTYIAIQATSPGETKVTVTPSQNTNAGGSVGALTAKTPQTFTLKQFDVFQLSSGSDLTGTEVTGDKPFVAIAGCASCYNARRMSGDVVDHYSEQLFPFQSWGSEYAIAGFQKQGGEHDQWRILSAQDAELTITPQISTYDGTIGGSNKVSIKAGVPYDIITRDNFHMSSNKPILVAGFLGDEHTYKDPSYTLVVPVQQFRNDYSFMVPKDYSENYISIIAHKDISTVKIYKTAGGTDSLIKDIKKADFSAISGTNYVFYRHNMGTAHAAYKLIADKPIGVQSYGYTGSSSYAYPLGLNLINLNGTN
ncbi:MAG: IgGFc-binding protein, partial [Proteobacteria bacterium]|nr:IgGFc-binding protein [Pseudomonadota bacterium]